MSFNTTRYKDRKLTGITNARSYQPLGIFVFTSWSWWPQAHTASIATTTEQTSLLASCRGRRLGCVCCIAGKRCVNFTCLHCRSIKKLPTRIKTSWMIGLLHTSSGMHSEKTQGIIHLAACLHKRCPHHSPGHETLGTFLGTHFSA